MEISTDSQILWQWEFIKINATLVYTWIVMAVLVGVSWFATRRITSGPDISRWQNLLESIIDIMRDQIRSIIHHDPDRYLKFLGSLYLLIALSNFLAFVPKFHPPTGSLSTTAALALCVFFAVPVFGIAERGLGGYLKHYIKPVPVMLPFHVISEVSRTLALAIRLFGNVMSGIILAAILLSVAPILFPVILKVLELLIGQVQAFIFAVLAAVYIASGIRAHQQEEKASEDNPSSEENDRKGE